MSASPPDKTDLEAGAQSPDADQMEQGESSNQPQLFDFEVKEQDRWLPIANGMDESFVYFVLEFSFQCPLLSTVIVYSCHVPEIVPPKKQKQKEKKGFVFMSLEQLHE